MNFNELFLSVKKKLGEHPEIMLERSRLSIQITDVFDNAFYILWENGMCTAEPFHYNDFDVSIHGSQHDIELLFTERQYIFTAHRSMNITGSFNDVMDFQRLLSYITSDSPFIVHEEIVSKMLLKQDMMREDLGIIMQSLQMLMNESVLKSVESDLSTLSVKAPEEKKKTSRAKASPAKKELSESKNEKKKTTRSKAAEKAPTERKTSKRTSNSKKA